MTQQLLTVRGLDKSFPGVQALKDVDFSLESGEIRGLIGENGAGKSTLIKILAGIYQEDNGEIVFKGEEVSIDEPAEARDLGLAFIHQDVNLVPYFNAIENIWLGFDYPRKRGKFDKSKMEKRVVELTDQLDFELDLHRPTSELSTANKWLVAILKAFMRDARVLVLDEPTAALTDEEIQELFTNLNKLKSKGLGIVYVSHRLEEVLEITDSITVLKNGKKVADRDISEVDKDAIIKLMTGGKGLNRFPETRSKGTGEETLLEVQNFTGDGFKNVDFSLNEKEILGFFGLVGAGRTELMETIFGLRDFDSGELYLRDEKINIDSPNQMIEEGLVLIPEDRREEGLVLGMGVDENISLPNLDLLLKNRVLRNIDKTTEKEETKDIVDRLEVKTPSLKQPVKFLSGGNQQKVVIGKWLFRNTSVFIFDEPTSGIDVGTREEIYSLIHELAEESSVIMVSSDLRELTGVCDRIAVMSDGKITGVLTEEEFSEENILQLAYEEVE